MGDFSTLEDLIIEHDTVTVRDKTFKVTGLALPHIVYIVRHHKPTLETLYQQAISGQLSGDTEAVMFDLIDKAPLLVGMIIACGMNEPKQAQKASGLPLSVQVEALQKIIRLTLIAEGGLEKLMETVAGAVAGLASLKSLSTPKT